MHLNYDNYVFNIRYTVDYESIPGISSHNDTILLLWPRGILSGAPARCALAFPLFMFPVCAQQLLAGIIVLHALLFGLLQLARERLTTNIIR